MRRITITLLCALCLTGCRRASSSTVDTSSSIDAPVPEVSASPTPKEKAIVVLADDLTKDYKANEVAADEKYKGHRVKVVGRISAIEKNALDEMVVRLEAAGSLLGVEATMDESQKRAVAGLTKGKPITLDCEGAGMVLETPMLRSCSVELHDAPAKASSTGVPAKAPPGRSPRH